MSIRREVSKVLGFTVPVGKEGTKWDDAFKLLEIEGRVTKKHIIEILKILFI